MITTFEDCTSILNSYEKEIVFPEVVKILSLAIGREKAVTNNDICNTINNKPKSIKTHPIRIRKMIHIIRVTDKIPFLIATSNGYYVSNDLNKINMYIQSLDDRLRMIYKTRKALRRQTKNFPTNQTFNQQRIIM